MDFVMLRFKILLDIVQLQGEAQDLKGLQFCFEFFTIVGRCAANFGWKGNKSWWCVITDVYN